MLFFGDEAKVIKPKWLVEEVKGVVSRMKQVYEPILKHLLLQTVTTFHRNAQAFDRYCRREI